MCCAGCPRPRPCSHAQAVLWAVVDGARPLVQLQRSAAARTEDCRSAARVFIIALKCLTFFDVTCAAPLLLTSWAAEVAVSLALVRLVANAGCGAGVRG